MPQAQRGPSPTILDVVENLLGDLTADRIDRLAAPELAELADRVNDFYDSWQPPQTDELRMYAGGWIAGNFAAPEAQTYLYTTLLYYPQTLIHDPIADWFFPRRHQLLLPDPVKGRGGLLEVQIAEPALLAGDGYYQFVSEPDRTKLRLKQVLPVFRELSELIRAGVIIPIPQWQLVEPVQKSILSAARHDVADAEFMSAMRQPIDGPAPRADQIRGLGVTPHGGWTPGEEDRGEAQGTSYFLNKTLAIADQTGSLYVPPAATDANLFDVRIKRTVEELRRKQVELRLAPALMSVDLPFLQEIDRRTLLAIRKDEAAFADWRAELRTVVRLIVSRPSEGEAFEAEAREVLNDALLPKVHEVEQMVSRSQTLKAAARGQVVELGVGTGALDLAARLGHQALDKPALAALGISAVARWVLSPFLRTSPAGTKAVLATLIKKRRRS